MNWISKWILTFKWKHVSKTLPKIFKEVQGNSKPSFYWMETGVGSLLFSCPSDKASLPVLRCSSLLGFSKHLFFLRNKQTHKQICCNFFLWVVLIQVVFTSLHPRVEFNFWFWFYCSIAMFLFFIWGVKFITWQMFIKAFLSLTR